MSNETLADILREMRNLGKLDEKSTDKIPRTLMGLGLRTYADRLAAALKREKSATEADALAVGGIVEASRRKTPGNSAAMRDALELAKIWVESHIAGCELTGRGGWLEKRDLLPAITAALSAPARNCDIYKNKKDDEVAFLSEECKHPCGNCTVNDKYKYGCALAHECGVEWLFATAKQETKGEADGSK